MKTTVLSFIFSLCLLNLTLAQTQSILLDNNNVRVKSTNVGPLFWDGATSVFEVPKGSGKSTIFASAQWIAGISNQQLHLFAETFKQGPVLNSADLQAGPISNNYSADFKLFWNRIWKVSQKDIQDFRNAVQLGHPIDSALYKDIIQWPSKGNIMGTDTNIANCAPFIDLNLNNKYEPFLGDYPSIKGDVCTYSIMNDDMVHLESNGAPLKFQINRMAYEFSTNNAVNNTLFVDYQISNRSGVQYDSVIFSSWVDFDLGNYADDFIGTDTIRNMIYAFNGDSLDEGASGYGMNPPAQACIFLKNKIYSSMSYNNDFSPIGNPSTPNHYYNYMNAIWKDGKPLVMPGMDSSVQIKTRYVYPGDPCSNNGWWEAKANNTPGDRRILGSIILPNQQNQMVPYNISLAFVYAKGNGGNLSSVCALKSAADEVISWYNNQVFGATNEVKTKETFTLFPNPAKNQITIVANGLKNADVSIYDIAGNFIKSFKLNESQNFPTSELNSGIYILNVKTETNNLFKRFMVEQ